MVVASFHLARLATGGAGHQFRRIPFDRRALRTVPGLRFGRLLGTARGQAMALSADLRRWALFTVWDDDRARQRFLADHPLPRRWDDAGAERFDVVLEPAGAHGSWDGVDPVAGGVPVDVADGPVAVVTRATVRWRKVPTFLRAVPPVEDTLHGAPGLLAAVGIGELPIGRQATFSLWSDTEQMERFAYRNARHAEVVQRTRHDGWYGEEWFARFRPREWSGTWDGERPLG